MGTIGHEGEQPVRAMRIAKKERQDWRIKAVIEAQNRNTAEEIFYAGHRQTASVRRAADSEKTTMAKPHPGGTQELGPTLGLLGYQERH